MIGRSFKGWVPDGENWYSSIGALKMSLEVTLFNILFSEVILTSTS